MIRNMAMVNSIGRVETIMLVIISMTKDMGMEICSGMMALCTKETGSKACSMDLVLSPSLMVKL